MVDRGCVGLGLAIGHEPPLPIVLRPIKSFISFIYTFILVIELEPLGYQPFNFA